MLIDELDNTTGQPITCVACLQAFGVTALTQVILAGMHYNCTAYNAVEVAFNHADDIVKNVDFCVQVVFALGCFNVAQVANMPIVRIPWFAVIVLKIHIE